MWLFAMAGCTADLSGDWNGQIECDEEDYDIAFGLTARGDGWEGAGVHEAACGDNDTCDVDFRINVAPFDGAGTPDLDIRLTECFWDYDDYNDNISCIEPEDAEWDGKDAMQMGLDGIPCWLDVER